MKRYDYIQFGALSILSHIAQGAAFILLFAAFGGTGTTSSFTFATPIGLALGVVYVSALSFLFGWGLRPDRGIDKNCCWNAAIVLYVLNLASLLVMPVPFGSGSILAMIWELLKKAGIPVVEGARHGRDQRGERRGHDVQLCALCPAGRR